ncbi:hypothetical protein DV737_g1003, partial [Chaetothyriales sp. CBS 132003]
MAPTRPLKRQKTNLEDNTDDKAKAAEDSLAPDTPTTPKRSVPQIQSEPSQDKSRSVSARVTNDTNTTHSQESLQPWYRTWPRKAPPIKQMVDQSAVSRNDAASEVASIVNAKIAEARASARNPAAALTLGKSNRNRLLPVDATTTNVHATQTTHAAADSMGDAQSQPELLNCDGIMNKTADIGKGSVKKTDKAVQDAAVKQAASTGPAEDTRQQQEKTTEANKVGWFGWIARRNAVASPPPNPDGQQHVTTSDSVLNGPASTAKDIPSNKKPDTSEPPSPNNKRSWLQMLGGDTASKAGPPLPKDVFNLPSKADPITRTKALDIIQPHAGDKSTNVSQASSLEALPPPALPGDVNKSSGWVFWSRERKVNSSAGTSDDQPHIGELAVSDTPSQDKPHRASISMLNEQPAKPEAQAAKPAESTKKAVATKTDAGKQPDKDPPPPPSTPEQKGSTKKPPAPKTDAGKQPDKDQVPPPPAPEQKGGAKTDSKTVKIESTDASAIAKAPAETASVKPVPSASSRRSGPHLLLPSLKETLTMQESPSILQQLTRLLYTVKQPEPRHLCIVKDPPRIRNALAIGVHGYFPAPMLRTFLGQPTGTSIKFADMAAKAINKWTKSRGYECQVRTAALEGEGRIAERVELLWKLLINWVSEIRKADFVMVACHSQGVPVAIMLVAKLILFGCIPAARIGICAMAGVSMGPFVEYKSRWISGSAGELFEFSDPNSRVSEEYLAALDIVLRAGVRLTYVGSIDDQLVSLESSMFAPVTHPHIFRAVSIDPRIHAPNFLSHLVGFVLKLRNLGAQDHGLIRELSSPLAGSLVTGEGHSRLYEDDAVYDLAVAFALETTALPGIPLMYRRSLATAPLSSGNPYVLPFAMRGILEEEFAKDKLRHEADDLLKQFDEWRPTTKVLKDVKFRLEGIRSKL